jgi:uncharacterized protein YPO0396
MELDLNTNISNSKAGFRLSRMEVFNWGTFHNKIWHIAPSGQNALLTGDIGSGKSTLVDAITTLLVPHQRITYNKAAGAETRERNLRSYIKGAFKNEKVAQSSKARDVYLRNGKEHYTVLLAVFSNEGMQQEVSLAQVFYMQNGQVQKFFVLGKNGLSIREDLSDFGNSMNNLKRALRQREDIQVFDSFSHYQNAFRQRFGLRQPEALELFHKTVSMKSVGNLTEFVREQMLGRNDIQQSIDELVKRYGELTEAHRAVRRAREQHELLAPLIDEDKALAKAEKKVAELEALLSEIPSHFAHLRIAARQQQLQSDYQAWLSNEAAFSSLETEIKAQRADLRRQEAARAGLDMYQRLERIRLELDQQRQERERRRKEAAAWRSLCEALSEKELEGYLLPDSATTFSQYKQRASEQLDDIHETLSELSRQKPDLHVRREKYRELVGELEAELDSLRKRPTLIPERNLRLRTRLLRKLGMEEGELPFAGELLQVREEESDWEGAIERVLHSFGLSLLVADEHYQRVSETVDSMQLGGKLVYLRLLSHTRPQREEPGKDSLIHKLRIKGDAFCYDWLEQELRQRYDYQCCEDMSAFRRARRGLTRMGQIKSGRSRHEKDDRYDVQDRSRFVLGWTNKAKIEALEQQLTGARRNFSRVQNELESLKKREHLLVEQKDLLNALLRFERFDDIDLLSVTSRIKALEEEQQKLQSGSEELRELEARIATLEQAILALENRKQKHTEQRGMIRGAILNNANQIHELLGELKIASPLTEMGIDLIQPDVEVMVEVIETLELPKSEPSAALTKALNRLEWPEVAEEAFLVQTQRKLLAKLQGNEGRITRQHKEVTRLTGRLIRLMTSFREKYPEESADIDADIRSLPEFRELHKRLVRDDIPRHEARFRELLRKGTIQGILTFQSRLEHSEREITENIASINKHLHDLDYNEGTYISITKEAVTTEDILEFKRDLKACLSGIYGDEKDLYSEAKFFQVKKLLDRFKAETEADRRWTRKVTDVREWYSFGADERFRDSDESKEFYSDSSGKSGGQKEKLAYTILASAIAFQFGLEWGKSRDRSFRFVLIDEAFGRGSDESTRYGLELFERLSLQLLIVTPLQKINVIEDYIEAVHFVSNPSGRESLVRNISKAEYEQEKEARFVSKRSA